LRLDKFGLFKFRVVFFFLYILTGGGISVPEILIGIITILSFRLQAPNKIEDMAFDVVIYIYNDMQRSERMKKVLSKEFEKNNVGSFSSGSAVEGMG